MRKTPVGLSSFARILSGCIFFAFLLSPLVSAFGDSRILNSESISLVEVFFCVLVVYAAEWALTPNAYVDLLKESGLSELESKKRAHNEVYLWWNVFAFFLNLVILWQSEGLYGSDWLFDERWPKIPCPRLAMLLIHMEIAHYLRGFVGILMLSKGQRKNDHFMMTLHHFVAASLLLASAITNFWKFAVTVLFLHDGCDIFLAGAKKADYANAKRTTAIMFVGLLISWPFFRFAWFGKLLFSAIFPPKIWFDKVGEVYSNVRIIHLFFVGTLSSLMVMNVLWYVRIAKIARSGEIKDARENNE